MTRRTGRDAPDEISLFDRYPARTLTAVRRRLLAWYPKNSRPLPWRQTGDPYRIWISEIMLQQTTVTAVVPYFHRFMEKFPTVHKLAVAPEDEVLRLWEGLGYYSRARNIHRAAKQIVTTLDGEFPRTVDELQSLPGIGRYTAGAIRSFAFDLPAPIVEANTLRLYARLLGYGDDPRATKGQRVLWAFAEHLVPMSSPGVMNQALMELGALICKPTEPDCPNCPLKSNCRAFAHGEQDLIPKLARRNTVTHTVEATVAVASDGRFLLRRNPQGERWAGLWDFIRFPLDEALLPKSGLKGTGRVPVSLAAALVTEVQDRTGLQISVERFVTEIRHSVTRFRIRLQCFAATVQSASPHTSDRRSRIDQTGIPDRLLSENESVWVRPEDFHNYPLSVTARQFADLLS